MVLPIVEALLHQLAPGHPEGALGDVVVVEAGVVALPAPADQPDLHPLVDPQQLEQPLVRVVADALGPQVGLSDEGVDQLLQRLGRQRAVIGRCGDQCIDHVRTS